MAHEIFLSYSTRDQGAADAICQALEGAGHKCWIAPRDIAAGTQWGGSIVSAIEASKAVLVIFSEKSNDSPQVVREMECAVAKRLPLIPVRIADAMPTKDMEYFLGVSHWLNAYPKPLESYLPQIVTTTERVLKGEAKAWQRFSRRVPPKRFAQLSLVAVAVLVAVLTAWLMRPAPTPPSANPAPVNAMEALKPPMSGRWQASLAAMGGMGSMGGKAEPCILDVAGLGQVQFSDTCPSPFTGAKGTLAYTRDGTWNQQLYVPGKDGGTFMMQGGTLPYTNGSFRLEGKDTLVLHFVGRQPITWSRIAQGAPLHNAEDDILPKEASWPVAGVPAIAEKALAYARSHWQPDAVLMSLKLELQGPGGALGGLTTTAGVVSFTFELYSPGTQNGISLTPGSAAGGIFNLGAIDRNPRYALPARFLDLPEAWAAIRARGMRGKELKTADLENWQSGTSAGGVELEGVEWMLDSALGERGTVRAAR